MSGVADSGGTVKEGIWWCPPGVLASRLPGASHPMEPWGLGVRGAIFALNGSKVLWKTRTALTKRPHLNPDPPLRGRQSLFRRNGSFSGRTLLQGLPVLVGACSARIVMARTMHFRPR